MNRHLWLVAVIVIAALSAACGQGAGTAALPSEPVPDPGIGQANGPPWLRGRVLSTYTTEPVTEDCVSEADPDGDGSVSSDDPPVCDPHPSSYGSLGVEGKVAGQQEPMPASVSVDKAVPLEDSEGNPIEWSDITKGSRVAVWITGEIAESYPVQVRATRIVLLSGG